MFSENKYAVELVTRIHLSVLLFALCGLLLTGCGGVTSDSVEIADNYTAHSEKIIPVRIVLVENATGDTQYDVLRHFIHIKAAQILNGTGKYEVVADDVLASMPDVISGEVVAEQYQLTVSIDKVKENSGGTVSFALFSAQGKNVEVTVSANLSSMEGEQTIRKTGYGKASKGAWGVLAKVDRDTMLENKGFWEVDNSMLGIAATKALDKAIGRM